MYLLLYDLQFRATLPLGYLEPEGKMSSVMHRIQARLPKKTIKFGKKMINTNAPPVTNSGSGFVLGCRWYSNIRVLVLSNEKINVFWPGHAK